MMFLAATGWGYRVTVGLVALFLSVFALGMVLADWESKERMTLDHALDLLRGVLLLITGLVVAILAFLGYRIWF